MRDSQLEYHDGDQYCNDAVAESEQTLLTHDANVAIFDSMTDQIPMDTPIEGSGGILVLRGSPNTREWNGIRYKTGLSAKNVGARKPSMSAATLPAGGVAYAHIHVDFEVMLYILEGNVRHEYGDGLTKTVENV